MALQPRTIRLPDRLWEWLEDEALRQGVSVAHLIRDILLVYRQREKAPSEDEAR